MTNKLLETIRKDLNYIVVENHDAKVALENRIAALEKAVAELQKMLYNPE